ncbi:MAG TPA: family 43 glycosylhydrolase [Mobilitalea sp.]|nr:family 43 glycosylhydrolase [Mobilitalea sp.]
MIQAINPILSGFYPDPSICRVGEDYYLVNSSFAYFPGVPIWHSKNLADWQQVGNILDRNSQVPLHKSGHSGGIFAPTIRYHDGIYYMITTNISGGGNFIVTATKPEEPWSEPYFLGGEAQGIDPSLFIDEDGTCYYVGTRPNPEGVRYNGDWEIWVQKLDLVTMRLIGKSYAIWKGALKDVIWPEGPHLYKKDDYYYLMIAEGGTGPNHAVTVARSNDVIGPYVNNPNNPILTHRHLGKDYPIIYVGHADLVDDINGNWYMVMLASRRCEGYVGLGRETFLAKVVWEDGWPVVNPGVGMLEDIVELPFDGTSPQPRDIQTLKNFNKDDDAANPDVVMLRNPKEKFYTNINGTVRLNFLPKTLKELESPAYLGFRQLEYNYEAVLDMEFDRLSDTEEAGLVILQSNEYHMLLRMKKQMDSEADNITLQVVKCLKLEEHLLAEKCLYTNELKRNKEADKLGLKIKIKAYGQKADFIQVMEECEVPLLENVDIHEMSTEIAGGFVGNTIGVYASSCGEPSENFIDIKDFTIRY